MLHLTNGDCAIEPLRAAGVEGEILPWRENLLEGPVPRGPSGAEHDDRLRRALAAREPVMLWFEADLFDVLLLVQILERVPSGAPVLMVLVGQERWQSVTDVAPALLASLGREAPPVSDAQLELARGAWAAFTSPAPTALEPLAAGTPALSAVGQAMHRLLEELPWAESGLSRTERQLLEALAGGARSREEAFMRTIAREERPFLGDLTAFAALDRLAPLHEEAGLTGRGRSVLDGDERWEPAEERWVGGTRIPPGPPPWLWEAGTVRAAR